MFALKERQLVLVGVLAMVAIPLGCSYEIGVEGVEITHERSESNDGQVTHERSGSPNAVSLDVEANEEGELRFEFSDGRIAESEEEYLTTLDELASEEIDISEIGLSAAEEVDEDGYSGEGDGYGWQRDPLRILWTRYHFRFVGIHTSWLGGGRDCIRRTVPHVSFIINRQGGGVVTDIHIASWVESGRRCVAIYVSPQGWCRKNCNIPRYDDIKNWLTTALVAIGISASVAAIMATILTPIAVGALAI